MNDEIAIRIRGGTCKMGVRWHCIVEIAGQKYTSADSWATQEQATKFYYDHVRPTLMKKLEAGMLSGDITKVINNLDMQIVKSDHLI